METLEYRDHTIEIENDDMCMNPREEFDNMGTLALKNSAWCDEEIDDEQDLFNLLISEEDYRPYDFSANCHDYYEIDSGKAWKNIEKQYIILPVYVMSHGATHYSAGAFGCPWDSGQAGWIYVSKSEARKECGWSVLTQKRIDKIKTYLSAEIETFDDCVNGEIYWYNIKDKNGEDIDESCGGFIGHDNDKNGLLEYAHNAIDCHLQSKLRKKLEKLKTLIKNKVALSQRAKLINA